MPMFCLSKSTHLSKVISICKIGHPAMSTLTKLPFTGHFNYVGGMRCSPVEPGNVIKVIHPATGQVQCEVPSSAQPEVNRAVQAAKDAFPKWVSTDPQERSQVLYSAAQIIRAQLEEIAVMETEDTGKPIWESRVDIAGCADVIQYYAGILTSALSGEIQDLGPGRQCHVKKDPLGVVAGIGAWNYPFQVLAWKAAPALAAGNTMVFKPSEFTPLTAVRLAEIFREAGAPPGAINIVQGSGATGQLLCGHPDVAKVTFTGSVATGQAIMRKCAADMKRLTLEMGGKSALLVLSDADLDLAVKATLIGNFLSQGAVCTNCTRVFVHESIQAEFERQLKKAARKLKVGDPLDESTTVGATISATHAARVESYIASAMEQDAQLVYGGQRETVSGLEGGIYLAPCILSHCRDDMRVVREEVFGSVVCLLTFSSVEEAVNRANSSPFGLAAGVMTRNIHQGQKIAAQLEAGTVWVNDYNVFPPQMPFGGYKLSGLGRENGIPGLMEFVQTKSIYVNSSNIIAPCPLFP